MSLKEKNTHLSLVDYLEGGPFHQVHLEVPKTNSRKMLMKRSLAFSIDISMIFFAYVLIDISYGSFLNEFFFFIPNSARYQLMSGTWFLQAFVTLMIFFCYFTTCLYILEGKTLGKVAMGLRTIKDHYVLDDTVHDYNISLIDCARRTMGYLTCYMSLGTFFSFSFFSEDQRGLPDYFSNTRTVSDEWLEYVHEQKSHLSEVYTIDINDLERKAA